MLHFSRVNKERKNKLKFEKTTRSRKKKCVNVIRQRWKDEDGWKRKISAFSLYHYNISHQTLLCFPTINGCDFCLKLLFGSNRHFFPTRMVWRTNRGICYRNELAVETPIHLICAMWPKVFRQTEKNGKNKWSLQQKKRWDKRFKHTHTLSCTTQTHDANNKYYQIKKF